MADFTWIPTYPFEEKLVDKVLKSNYDSGHTQVRHKWSSALRIWTLRFDNVVESTYEAIRDFYAIYGAHTSFSWAHPATAVEYTVRFVEDSFTAPMVGFELYSFELQLEEVR